MHRCLWACCRALSRYVSHVSPGRCPSQPGRYLSGVVTRYRLYSPIFGQAFTCVPEPLYLSPATSPQKPFAELCETGATIRNATMAVADDKSLIMFLTPANLQFAQN